MVQRKFKPASKGKRIRRNLLVGFGVGFAAALFVLRQGPRLWWLALLIGAVAGFITFAPLAFNQPDDLQSITLSAQDLTVESKKERRSLRWNEIARACFRSYEGTRWVFISPGKRDLIFMVEGFQPQEEEAINSIIRTNLESNNVEIAN